MKSIQVIFIAVMMAYASGSLLDKTDDWAVVLATIQNKLGTITSANNLATSQIATNTAALANIQTQLDQVLATNDRTLTAINTATTRFEQMKSTLVSFHAAIGPLFTANGGPGVGAAYGTAATAIQAV